MSNDNTLRRSEQVRASKAYEFAQTGEKLGGGKKTISKDNSTTIEDSKDAKEYKAYVKKIPMMIKSNGLGATLAFVKSKEKKKEAYQLIYKQLAEWLIFKELIANGDLVKEVIDKSSSEYRMITVETLALFNWLRRFAEGLIQGEADSDD